MKSTLGEDYDEYIRCFDNEPFRGLRVNTLKCDDSLLLDKLHISMKKTPFYSHGYYIENSVGGLGNHPFHHAGAFYLQEPSAMSAVTALQVSPGDKVLDLCAAPGGKSTQIAAQLCGEGLLVSNEIVASRAKILCSNLERMGVKNAVVTNDRPDAIAEELCGFFDKVLVDAPCSGEGMIRREPAAVSEWRLESHDECAARDEKILDSAAKCVKNGGVLVFSTCTLSPQENEQTVARFLHRHPEFQLDDIAAQFGRAAYSRVCDEPDIVKARRIIYPDGGEGHFVARMVKISADTQSAADIAVYNDKNPLFEQFMNEHFNVSYDNIKTVKNSVYIMPEFMPVLNKIHVLRAGIFAGEAVKNRFEPSHQLYVSHSANEHKQRLDLDCDDEQIRRFLHGEEIDCGLKGYTAVSVNGVVTGLGKASNGRLKNRYPKGLRTLK